MTVGMMTVSCVMAWAGAISSSPIKVVPFDLAEVRLLDGPFKHAQDLDHKVLLALDPDRFLYNFRVNAGLPSTAEPADSVIAVERVWTE